MKILRRSKDHIQRVQPRAIKQLFDSTKHVPADVEKFRLDTCKGCEHFAPNKTGGGLCKKCGCQARYKLKPVSSMCVAGKWGATTLALGMNSQLSLALPNYNPAHFILDFKTHIHIHAEEGAPVLVTFPHLKDDSIKIVNTNIVRRDEHLYCGAIEELEKALIQRSLKIPTFKIYINE